MDSWTVLLFGLLAGCSSVCEISVNSYGQNQRPERYQLRQAGFQRPDSLTMSDCHFALRFYQTLVDNNGEGNVLFSPLSLLTVVGALTEGAGGATAEELLRITSRTVASIVANRPRTQNLLNQLNQVSSYYTMTFASRLYLQDSFDVRPEFLGALRYYGMEVKSADFQLPHAVEMDVNQWVAQVTRGHIGVLIPPGTLDVQTRLVLANAVFFKGDWETMFPAENTRPRQFFYRRNKAVQVPTMSVQGDFPYGDFPKYGFEMLELLYTGRNVSLVIVLPYAGKSLTVVTRRLVQRPGFLNNPGRRMTVHSTTVFLPKFQMKQSVDVKEVLEQLGLRLPFEQGRADFSNISTEGQLFVSDVLHKAAIEVSERGTKASAASAVVIKGRSMSSDPVFRASRPFLFFLRHNPSATILFLGHVRHLKDST